MVRFSDIIKIKDKKVSAPLNSESLEREDSRTKGRENEELISFRDSFSLRNTPREDLSEAVVNKQATNVDVIKYYEKFIERAQDIQQRVKGDKGISPSPVLAELHTIIDMDLIDDLYEYAMSVREDFDEMVVHTVDVTFTALKIGKGMDYDIKKLLRLGLAAFLENVGMYRIPGSILESARKLSEEEIRVIKRHPEESYELLSQLGERYRWLAEAALNTHERMDGSGYPRGLKKDEIPELSYILGLVDTYIAMIKERPYREKFIQTDAVKSIVEASRGKFPANVVKIFLNQISLFPVGSYIKLNNNSIGRVISTDKRQPLRPTIELLFDGAGKQLEHRQTILLSENPLLFIDSSVDSEKYRV